MAVITCLLVGDQTWKLQERSIRSLRACHPDQDIILYHSLDDNDRVIANTLENLDVKTVDIGKPGLLGTLESSSYSEYSTLGFNIKTSFKWQAILATMLSRRDDVIFIDADIAIISPLPFSTFQEIWKYYDIFVQDEGNQVLPRHPCTGFIGFRCNDANIALLETLHKAQCATIVSDHSKHDQTIFAEHISANIEAYKNVYFLPQMLFPVGYMAPIYNRCNQTKVSKSGILQDPYIYHANWFVGLEAKSIMMDAMLNINPVTQGNDGASFIEYVIGRFTLKLPIDHMLPVYQASHPRYDRFLPHLLELLPHNSMVIDVGANCGDSLAAMASVNPKMNFVCIEADKDFYSLLQFNIEGMKQCTPDLRVVVFNELIGKKLGKACLAGSGGTKRAVTPVKGKDIIKAQALDVLLEANFQELPPITLLKVDTDGWDYDVINSASEIIEKHRPIIFFEYQCFDDDQYSGYLKMVASMQKQGYSSWYLFDNFGEFMIKLDDIGSIQSFAAYIMKQNKGLASRTMFYMDILAIPSSYQDIAEAAIASYAS